MIPASVSRRTKVVLTDYPYCRDIENRLMMAHLSDFEVTLLREILHHSLKISIEHLAESLETTIDEIIPVLDKLSITKLFKRTHLTLIVDKEMRKYYESQIEKFDEGFQPDMEFLQGLLNKVSIHTLPIWYSISKTSDNIFGSIIEKYFLTPKIYRQYLEELEFDSPVIPSIIKDLYQAPDFKLPASFLIEKYQLTREQFEEYLLLLEYYFICCLRYDKVGDRWQEVITPFQEWLDYLKIEAQSKPPSIVDKDQIKRTCQDDFGFILDMQTILRACARGGLKHQDIPTLFSKEPRTASYLENLLFKLNQLNFINQDTTEIRISDKGSLWLAKSLPEQVTALSLDPLNTLRNGASSPVYNIRNLRVIEKSLKHLAHQEWIYLDDFLKGFISPLGNKEPITLKNKGKKWKYVIPTYTAEEYQFIQAAILERLFELGIVATGIHQGRICLCLTSFGRLSLN